MIIAWILLSLIVAAIGSTKKIGFGLTLLLSLFLSPVIGVFCVMISESYTSPSVAYKCKHCGHTTIENHTFCPNCRRDDHGREFIKSK